MFVACTVPKDRLHTTFVITPKVTRLSRFTVGPPKLVVPHPVASTELPAKLFEANGNGKQAGVTP